MSGWVYSIVAVIVVVALILLVVRVNRSQPSAGADEGAGTGRSDARPADAGTPSAGTGAAVAGGAAVVAGGAAVAATAGSSANGASPAAGTAALDGADSSAGPDASSGSDGPVSRLAGPAPGGAGEALVASAPAVVVPSSGSDGPVSRLAGPAPGGAGEAIAASASGRAAPPEPVGGPAPSDTASVDPAGSTSGAAGDGPHPGSVLPAADGSGPTSHQVKVNRGSGRYHTPDSPYYVRTRADFYFVGTDEAAAAGFVAWNAGRGGS